MDQGQRWIDRTVGATIAMIGAAIAGWGWATVTFPLDLEELFGAGLLTAGCLVIVGIGVGIWRFRS
jgi:hypothetical protein